MIEQILAYVVLGLFWIFAVGPLLFNSGNDEYFVGVTNTVTVTSILAAIAGIFIK